MVSDEVKYSTWHIKYVIAIYGVLHPFFGALKLFFVLSQKTAAYKIFKIFSFDILQYKYNCLGLYTSK